MDCPLSITRRDPFGVPNCVGIFIIATTTPKALMMMIANDFLCNKVMFAQSSESPPNNNSNNMMIRAGARNVIMASTVSSKGLIFALLWLVIHWIFERLLLLIIFSFLFFCRVFYIWDRSEVFHLGPEWLKKEKRKRLVFVLRWLLVRKFINTY